MTMGEIYDSICFHKWGDAVPPGGAQLNIVRMLISAHRKVQRDHNFWFMLQQYAISTVETQNIYVLPDTFKEIEFCNFSTPAGAKTEPLIELDLSSDEEMLLEFRDATSEFPEYYMCDGTNIRLYPIPSVTGRTLNIRLWKFLPAPSNVYATFRDHNDAVSTYMAEALIFHVLSDLSLVENEWQASQLWKQRYMEEVQAAMNEDERRRQNTTGRYHGI